MSEAGTNAAPRRWAAFDVLRGIGIIGVVVLHSSLYHYANLLKIDFADPPPVVTVIGLLLMWAGLFAVVSSAVNAAQSWRRLSGGEPTARVLRWSLVSGGVMLGFAYLYFLVLGPAILDRVKGDHDYSMLMSLLVKGTFAWPSLNRVLYVDSLVMIAYNLALVALVLWVLTHRRGTSAPGRVVTALLVLGGAVVLASYTRIWLYPIVEAAVARGDIGTAWPLAYLANKNNPILPFLGFGCVGAALGVALTAWPDQRRLWRLFVPFGVAWLAAGIIGYVTLPDTMLERAVDPMWFYIMVAQVGLFVLLAIGTLRFLDFAPVERAARRVRALAPVRRFGVAALTVFLLETPVSEIASRLLDALTPGWNDTMGGALAFGFVMALLWGVALWAWERAGLPFPAEALYSRLLHAFGRPTTKRRSLREPAGIGVPGPASEQA
jgi:hypothetical protein